MIGLTINTNILNTQGTTTNEYQQIENKLIGTYIFHNNEHSNYNYEDMIFTFHPDYTISMGNNTHHNMRTGKYIYNEETIFAYTENQIMLFGKYELTSKGNIIITMESKPMLLEKI